MKKLFWAKASSMAAGFYYVKLEKESTINLNFLAANEGVYNMASTSSGTVC